VRPAANWQFQVAAAASMSHRHVLLTCFVLLQAAAYFTTIVIVATDFRVPDPWPIVASFGVILAQCSLAAGIAVFGPWHFTLRMICSAAIVIAGGALLISADATRPRWPDIFLIGLFALLMWTVNQMPLWLCRLLLHARPTTVESADNHASRSQYGIRQLMALTLAVSLTLGIGRMIFPERVFEELRNMKAVNWLAFGTIAVAAGLLIATTIMTTLNPRYLRSGLAVSAACAALNAWAVYSVLDAVNFGPANERIFFVILILCAYAWLQISTLIIRTAGYRILVGA
jgi:hypothetical protein